MIRIKSPKGFVAIDLDGTALIEKIDKNIDYGLKNPQSHLRQTLIEYIRAAQEAGYDIIILTARPELVEMALASMHVGTKPTNDIVSLLNDHGIKIQEIVRSPSGLKGKRMQDMLDGYHADKHDDAMGMLFDDQLKQVNDVRKLGNPKLKAYDINAKNDLEDYIDHVPLCGNEANPFHPEQIVTHVLKKNDNLSYLNVSVVRMDKKKHPKEAKLAKELIGDLCIRLYEAQYRKYQPEIYWVVNVTSNIQCLVDKLNAQRPITNKDIEHATRTVFSKNTLERVKPNSNCDVLMKNLLKACMKRALIHNLREHCRQYLRKSRQEAKTVEATVQTLQQHQACIISQLMRSLNGKENTKPELVLQSFIDIFTENKDKLRQSFGGNTVLNFFRFILVKVPFLSDFFKTYNDKLSSKMEYSIINVYVKDLDETADDSIYPVDSGNYLSKF